MSKLAAIVTAGAVALAGCGVNVSSNDSDTQNAINSVGETASDLVDAAGNAASDVGNEFGEAARDTGNAVQNVGESIDGTGGNKAN